MVAHKDDHYLAFGQPAGAVPVPYAVLTHGGETQVLGKFLTGDAGSWKVPHSNSYQTHR